MKRESLRDILTEKWEAFSSSFFENDEIERITYDECYKLINQTKKYFDALPVKGTLDQDDFKLYETISSLRYFPLFYDPCDDTEDFDKVCKMIKDLLESLEAMAK